MALARSFAGRKNCHACGKVDKSVATAKKKAEAKRISKKKGKKSAQDKAYAKLNNFKPRTIQTNALKTGVFEDNKEGFRRLLSHCYDEDTIRAAMALRKKISKLNFVRDSKLGEGKDMTNPKHRKNLRKKNHVRVIIY